MAGKPRSGPTAGPRLLDPVHPSDLAWMERGRCYGLDRRQSPDFFDYGQPNRRQAEALCALCPVAGPCLEYALRHRIDFGIWGGTSGRERRRLLRERAAARRRS